ncbi:MAG: TrmH family RNA methyltransferase [Muribaculaceae bacterium]|nr:TrmH family RNA methyltransferase [Muribaculaceae bacterium]
MNYKKSLAELTNCSVEEYRMIPKLPLCVLLDNVRSMQNVGSLLRTADAFLVKEVVMAGITGVPPHKEISKTSLGAEDSVAWRHVDDAVKECRRLKAEGKTICVLEQAHGSIDLSEFTARGGSEYVLVVGNEVDGVDSRIVEMADVILEISMHGVKHSLNVAVSGGIALWKITEEIGKLQRPH